MIGITTTNARVGGFRGGKKLDPNAQAFITAAGITDATQINAINRLVKNYKGIGDLNASVDLWTGSKAIYPYVGGSATNHKFNLKDPRDLDAAYRLLFSGGWTHSANGIIGNNTNTFANSYLKPNDMGQNNHRNLGYLRTDIGGLSFCGVFGATNAGFVNGLSFEISKTVGNHASYSNTTFQVVANANRTGLMGLNRTGAGSFKVFRNGNSLYSVTAASLAPIGVNMYVGAQNNNGALISPTAENLAFNVVGDGLSDANLLIEYNIIQAFQTDLSRNV